MSDDLASTSEPTGRGGAIVRHYDHDKAKLDPAREGFAASEEEVWQRIGFFLEHAVPAAEKAGVRLACHHDDPPVPSLLGETRVLGSVAALVLMMVKAADKGGAQLITGVSIFGAALVMLYLSSTLYHALTPPRAVYTGTISRIKILSNMDIAERRIPQDGRASIRIGDGEVDAGTVRTDTLERMQILRDLRRGEFQVLVGVNLLREGLDLPEVSLVAYNNQNNRTIIEVADNGSGIKPDIIDKIFMPFFTSKKEGSGIGLSLSRQIMHLHKGSISVKSKDDEGTVFTLKF